MNDRNVNARRPAPAGRTPSSRRAPAGTAGASGNARPAARKAAGRRASSGHWAGADRRYTAAKWALLVALAVYTYLVVGANSARNVDFGTIAAAIAAAPEISELDEMNENAFQDRLGTSPEGCEGWLMYGSDEIMNVSELVIARADEATLDRLEAAAEARIDAQLDVFRNYGAEQTRLLEGAALWRRGSYLFYGVGDDQEQWEDAFLRCVR